MNKKKRWNCEHIKISNYETTCENEHMKTDDQMYIWTFETAKKQTNRLRYERMNILWQSKYDDEQLK